MYTSSMALTWTTLLLLCAVAPAVSQNFGDTECSSNPLHYGSYMVSNSNCCTSFIITALLRQCCTDGGSCRCSPTLSVTCPQAAATAAPTAPTTTTTITTTTTTTPTPPTTTPSVTPVVPTNPAPSAGLCPSAVLPTGRLLNSAMVSSGVCTGSGTIGFTTSTGQICNGAYGKNPTTGETVIYTLATCWAQSPTAGVIGDETIPFDSCSVTSATASPLYPTVTTLTLSPMASFFLGKMFEGCPNSDCLYNPFVMQNAIDWRKCYTASYGATTLGEMGGQLNMVPVSLADATQCFNLPAGSQCFKATSGTPCTTDNGAPLYCSLTTGETVLYGLTTVNNCLSGNTAFNVMPLFGATGTEITLP